MRLYGYLRVQEGGCVFSPATCVDDPTTMLLSFRIPHEQVRRCGTLGPWDIVEMPPELVRSIRERMRQ